MDRSEQQSRPRFFTTLARGWRRRCPRCGEGPLFRKWITTHERCSECHLLFQRDYGDTLGFMIITDRIPLLLGIAAVYFGFSGLNRTTAFIFFAALAIPMLATIRQRQGVALALDFLSRFYVPDPSDEMHRRPPMQAAQSGTRIQ